MKKVQRFLSPRRGKIESQTMNPLDNKSSTSSDPPPTDPFQPLPHSNIDCTSIIISTWNITGSLRVSTNVKIDSWLTMERILEYMLDAYDGNKVFQPLIITIYWLLGIHLQQIEGPSNRFSWGIDFGEPIEIKHCFSLIGSQSFNYTKNVSSIYRGTNFSIEFWVKFSSTHRRSTPLHHLLGVGQLVFPNVRRFGEILKFSHINCEQDSTQCLILK